MKTYLLVSGIVFLLFAVVMVVVVVGHWGGSESTLSFNLGHAALGVGMLALAVWSFRLARKAMGPAA
jgi:hypothetical protein